MIFGVDFQFQHHSRRDMQRLYSNWTHHRQVEGYSVSSVTHLEFGGITSACHLVIHRGIEEAVFHPPTATPRTLQHVLNSASRGAFQEVPPPPPLTNKHSGRRPLKFGDSFRIEGLLDVHDDQASIICPCVFKRSGWSKQTLTPTEFLRAYNSPLHIDQFLESLPWTQRVVAYAISPLVLSAVICALWGVTGGGLEGTTNNGSGPTLLCVTDKVAKCESSSEGTKGGTNGMVTTPATSESSRVEVEVNVSSYSTFGKGNQSPVSLPPLGPSASADEPPAAVGAAVVHECVESTRLDTIWQEHDIAKAVKSDDAAVPVHLWDERLGSLLGLEMGIVAQAAGVLRMLLLRIY